MASEHIKRSPSAHGLAEPEDLLHRIRVPFIIHPDMQSLIDSDGTRLVSWIGGYRAMAHLHELDLLKLCQFLWVGRDCALGGGRGPVARRGGGAREVFGEESVGGFVLWWRDWLRDWTRVLRCVTMRGTVGKAAPRTQCRCPALFGGRVTDIRIEAGLGAGGEGAALEFLESR